MMGAVREQAVGVPAEGLLQQYGVIPWRKDRLGGMRAAGGGCRKCRTAWKGNVSWIRSICTA